MKTKYSQKIDKEIFNEVNRECPRLSKILDFEFKQIKFNKRVILIAKDVVKISKYFVNGKKVKSIMESIFNKKVPAGITIYVNTTPFCTWNIKNKWISISMRFIGKEFFNKVCHEMNHFMYDHTFRTKKYQDIEIKETLTVLNNIFGVEDKGWKKFSEQREEVLEFYNTIKDFKKTINYTRNLFRK